MNKVGVLEGILFVVGDEGITLDKIASILEVTTEEAKGYLKELQQSYENDNRGIRISFLGNCFKLTTKKEHKEFYQKLSDLPEIKKKDDVDSEQELFTSIYKEKEN